MTDNQEKELFNTLATLVTGVNGIQFDVKELKSDVHGLKSDVQELKSDVHELKSDVHGLKSDVQELKSDVHELKSDVQDIKKVQNEHSRILKRLDAKTDTIAEKVLTNDKRLTAVEKDVSDLRGGIH